jgi:hypothetical protein
MQLMQSALDEIVKSRLYGNLRLRRPLRIVDSGSPFSLLPKRSLPALRFVVTAALAPQGPFVFELDNDNAVY